MMRDFRHIWWGIFAVLSVLLVIRLVQELPRATYYGTHPEYDSEKRVNIWLMSANCFKETHVLLGIYGPGRIYPIEDVSVADDRGHVLLASVIGLFRAGFVDRVLLTQINLWINAVGILVLAGMLRLVQMPFASLLSLVLGMRYGMPGPIPGHDAPASYFGIFCLAAVPVIWLASSSVKNWAPSQWISGNLISFLSLAWAFLLRQAVGLAGGIVCGGLFIGYLFRKRPVSKPEVARAVLTGLWLFGATQVTPILLASRNLWYGWPPAHSIHSHGIWHSMYLGLGTEPNPWGIIWDDRMGVRVAKEVEPTVEYGTPRYFAIMRQLYFQRWRESPITVIKIYASKLEQTWGYPLYLAKIRIGVWVFAVLVTAIALWTQRRRWGGLYPLWMLSVFIVFYAVFSMQGVTAIPTATHLYPLKFCLLLMFAFLADYLYDVVWRHE